jgi:hypothetical protein
MHAYTTEDLYPKHTSHMSRDHIARVHIGGAKLSEKSEDGRDWMWSRASVALWVRGKGDQPLVDNV